MMRSLLTAVLFASLGFSAQAAHSKARQSPQAAGYLAFLVGTRTSGVPTLTFNLSTGTRAAGYLAFQTAAKPVLAVAKPVPSSKTASTAPATSTSSLSSLPATTATAVTPVATQQSNALTISLSQPIALLTGGSTPTAVQTSGGRPSHPPVVILPPPTNDQPIYSYP